VQRQVRPVEPNLAAVGRVSVVMQLHFRHRLALFSVVVDHFQNSERRRT
jgi:hypothetical protein